MEALRSSIFAVTFSLGACAHGDARSPARPIVVDGPGCPTVLHGARVAMTELDEGIALDFTTPGDVDALRTVVRRIGDSAATADLDRGVRVTLAPVDPREYDELEVRARRAVFDLGHGDCSCLRGDWLALLGPDLEIAPRR